MSNHSESGNESDGTGSPLPKRKLLVPIEVKPEIIPCKSPDKKANIKEKLTNNGRLMEAEKMERGSIPWNTYHVYIKAAGGYIVTFLVLLTFVFNILSSCKDHFIVFFPVD